MPKYKKNEMKSKKHRKFRPGASRMRPNDKVTARIDSNVEKERRETARKKRLNEMARDSAFAIQQKARDIAEAEARASARLAAEASRRAELASFVPPTASTSVRVTRKKKTVKLSPSSLELALLEQEEKEKAAAIRLEQRKAKAKEVKELFQKTQKAKKNREHQVRLEKRYDLEHLSYENALAEKRDELLDKGMEVAEAEKQAKFWADHYTDPKLRVYINEKMAWGDIALKDTPPKVEPKPKKIGTAAVPLIPESSIRVSTMDYRKAARKAPEFVPDYKTLVVLNLPYEPGKKIDRRKLYNTVFGKLTGTEIFGSARPTKEDGMIVSITVMRLNGTLPRGDMYQSKTDEPLKVMAYVTYPSHELAKKALEFSKMRGLYIKDTLMVIEPVHKK